VRPGRDFLAIEINRIAFRTRVRTVTASYARPSFWQRTSPTCFPYTTRAPSNPSYWLQI